MIRILEKQAIRRQAKPIDLRTCHRMVEQGFVGENVELIRGVLIEKMRKTPLHETVIRKIFRRVLAASAASMIVTKEAPISVVDSEPEPDIAVVLGSDDDFAEAHPNTALLVMEIAVSSEEIDREKASIYAEAGIAEFWLVLAVEEIVEVHTQPRDGVYTACAVYQAGDTVISTVLPLLQIPLREIFPG